MYKSTVVWILNLVRDNIKILYKFEIQIDKTRTKVWLLSWFTPLRFFSGRWAETLNGETWSLDLGGWKNKYRCKMTWKVFELLSTFKINFFASFTMLWDKQLQLSCSMQNNLKCLQTEQQVIPPCCQFIQAGLDLWSQGWRIAYTSSVLHDWLDSLTVLNSS